MIHRYRFVFHYSIRQIADILRRSPSTISRELKRNSFEGKYNPELADQIAHARKCVSATKELNGPRGISAKFIRRRKFGQRKERSLVAWESDTFDYYYQRIWFLPKSRVRRISSRFWVKMDQKPDHFSKLHKMKMLLLRQMLYEDSLENSQEQDSKMGIIIENFPHKDFNPIITTEFVAAKLSAA